MGAGYQQRCQSGEFQLRSYELERCVRIEGGNGWEHPDHRGVDQLHHHHNHARNGSCGGPVARAVARGSRYLRQLHGAEHRQAEPRQFRHRRLQRRLWSVQLRLDHGICPVLVQQGWCLADPGNHSRRNGSRHHNAQVHHRRPGWNDAAVRTCAERHHDRHEPQRIEGSGRWLSVHFTVRL